MISTEQGLRRVRELAPSQDWLAVMVTTPPSGTPAVSVVNVGIVAHPVTGNPVLALVSRGNTAKLRNVRATEQATLVFRAGWDWIAVRGHAEIAGPDDSLAAFDSQRLPTLLRDIFTAAGGNHPDLAEYDREMARDRRAAILVSPERFSSNPTPHDRE